MSPCLFLGIPWGVLCEPTSSSFRWFFCSFSNICCPKILSSKCMAGISATDDLCEIKMFEWWPNVLWAPIAKDLQGANPVNVPWGFTLCLGQDEFQAEWGGCVLRKKVSYCFERAIGSQALFFSQQTLWGYDSFACCWQSSHRHRRASLGMKLTLWMVDGKTERPQVLDDMLSHWINWTWNTYPTPSTRFDFWSGN